MISTTRAATIRAIFNAYMSNDRRVVEDALADDFRFTSPYDDQIDKKTYFERCWKNSDWIERHELEKIFVEGDEAFVTYRCTATAGRVDRGHLPGLVGVVSSHGNVHVAVLGKMGIGGAPLGRASILRIASMTNPVTAAAAVVLVEACKLRLDAPVDPWLPELADR